MYDNLFDNLVEANFTAIKRKQRSIKRLFPDFDYKTKGVEMKGGLKLIHQDATRWFFKVHSGTKDDVWYDNIVAFIDAPQTLKKIVLNKRFWSKRKGSPDIQAIAREFMKRTDVQLNCTCPAALYWGSAYILSLSKYDAKYGDRETRRPKIRNPRKLGAVCKHLSSVLKVMPFYLTTLVKWLKEFYSEDIARWVKAASAHTAMAKDVSADTDQKKSTKSSTKSKGKSDDQAVDDIMADESPEDIDLKTDDELDVEDNEEQDAEDVTDDDDIESNKKKK